MTAALAAPDRAVYEPFVPTQEQADFILAWYEIDPVSGRFRYRRGLLGRGRGWGKSPILAALSCADGLADVVPNGWDADGQPVGRPWRSVRTPLIQLAAVSDAQTANTWTPLLEMLRGPDWDGPALALYPGLEPLDTFVNLPGGGQIEKLTSSATTVKGSRPCLGVLDQTEEWTASNGGVALATTMRVNAAKVGGRTLESPNAFMPGRGSVAESTAAYWDLIRAGRAAEEGLLYDHREAPAQTRLDERESLVAGLRYAYGDSSDHPDGCVLHDPPCPPGWAKIDRFVAEIWDPANDPQQMRADFLNQITHAGDSWMSRPEWAARARPDIVVRERERMVLGFDGSRRRSRGTTDATALIATRVLDGHQVEVDVWTQPRNQPADEPWQVPTDLVDARVRETFRGPWQVVGMYADPALWETWVAKWEAEFTRQLLVKASREHPMEWWMTGGRAGATVRMLAAYRSAIVDGEMTHDGSATLTAHILNARRRQSRSGTQIAKPHPESEDKIDAAVAAALSWECRVDALAAGLATASPLFVPSRIR